MTYDVYAIRRQFPILERTVGDKGLHYLDNAAMTQTPRRVTQAMADFETHSRANAKRSLHTLAEESTASLELSRQTAANYLNAEPAEIIFTGSTTMGLNMLAWSLGSRLGPGDEILLSQLEHHSNLVPWQMLCARSGARLVFLPIDGHGRIELDRLGDYLSLRTRIVSLSHASNVTAALTDIAPVSQAIHAAGALLVLDGAQAASQGPLDPRGLGADFYVFSAHKVYGPTGIGVLWGRREILEELPPALGGGEMIAEVSLKRSTYAALPHRFEAGTPPLTQAVGLAAALTWLTSQEMAGVRSHLCALTTDIMSGLEDLGVKDERIRILGPPPAEGRLPLVCFVIEGAHPHDICQVMNDRHGVALRGGHHCAQPLHDLWGLDGSTRVSLAAYSSAEDIAAFLEGIGDCLGLLCRS